MLMGAVQTHLLFYTRGLMNQLTTQYYSCTCTYCSQKLCIYNTYQISYNKLWLHCLCVVSGPLLLRPQTLPERGTGRSCGLCSTSRHQGQPLALQTCLPLTVCISAIYIHHVLSLNVFFFYYCMTYHLLCALLLCTQWCVYSGTFE